MQKITKLVALCTIYPQLALYRLISQYVSYKIFYEFQEIY